MESIRSNPLLQNKMMLPVLRENLVHRRHLMDQIEQGIEQGFILISAPPGYGKTTLAADWAYHSQTPVAWLTLDAHDNDLSIFTRYLNTLAVKNFSLEAVLLEEISPERNPWIAYQALLTQLVNACAQSSVDFSLVLDDYQVIDNPQIHDGITFLLDHFPPHFRLVMISRSDPPFSLARLRANHRILELRDAELAFSLEETGQFLNHTVQLDLTEMDISDLYNKTEGWITGLQLASLARKDTTMIRQPGVSISGDAHLTIEYIVDEVINLLPSSTQDFLLRTSILTSLCGPLCEYVVEPFQKVPDARELLHTLYHSNLFLDSMDPGERWFRYHPVFSRALRHLLGEKFPDEISTLYARASDWYYQNTLYEDAMTYAADIDDRQLQLDLLEKYSIEAIRHNRILDILGIVRRLEESLLSASPVLSLIYSWGYFLSFDVDIGEIWVNRARELLNKPGSASRYHAVENAMEGMLSAMESLLAASRGEREKALELSEKALQFLPAENDFSHSFALLNRGIALSINGEVNQAIQALEDAVQASQKSGNGFVMVIARGELGDILIDNGQLTRAMEIFEQTIRLLSSIPGKFFSVEKITCKQIAEIFLARNQLAEAEQYLKKSIEGIPEWNVSFNDFDTHLRLAHLYQCQGDFQHADQELETARQLSFSSHSRLDDLILGVSEARWALLRGQTLPAQKFLQKIGVVENAPFQDLPGIPFSIADNIHLVFARLCLVQGRLGNDAEQSNLAVERLAALLPNLESGGLVEHQIEAYVLLASAYQELGRMDEALEAMRKALARAEPEEFRQVFLDEGIYMSRLLVHYLSTLKQNRAGAGLLSRDFVLDLFYRLTGKEADGVKAKDLALAAKNEDNFLVELLTARENEVLNLVARGCSNNEIALDLHISINTVKRHLNNIFTKLGVTTRTQAVRVASQKGLIEN